MLTKQLNEKEIEAVWKEFKTTNSKKSRDALILNYYPMVVVVAKSLNKEYSYCGYTDFDDIVSFGIIGLINAVDRFDPERGNKFSSYAYHRIRGAIIDEMRKMDPISRNMRCKIKNVKSEIIENENNDDIYEKYSQTEHDKNILKCIVNNNNIDEIIADTLYKNSVCEDPHETFEKMELSEHIHDCISKLTKRQRDIIFMYYFKYMKISDISKEFNVTEPAITVQKSKAMYKLHSILNKEIVSDFIIRNDKDYRKFNCRNVDKQNNSRVAV